MMNQKEKIISENFGKTMKPSVYEWRVKIFLLKNNEIKYFKNVADANNDTNDIKYKTATQKLQKAGLIKSHNGVYSFTEHPFNASFIAFKDFFIEREKEIEVALKNNNFDEYTNIVMNETISGILTGKHTKPSDEEIAGEVIKKMKKLENKKYNINSKKVLLEDI